VRLVHRSLSLVWHFAIVVAPSRRLPSFRRCQLDLEATPIASGSERETGRARASEIFPMTIETKGAKFRTA